MKRVAVTGKRAHVTTSMLRNIKAQRGKAVQRAQGLECLLVNAWRKIAEGQFFQLGGNSLQNAFQHCIVSEEFLAVLDGQRAKIPIKHFEDGDNAWNSNTGVVRVCRLQSSALTSCWFIVVALFLLLLLIYRAIHNNKSSPCIDKV